MTHKIVEGYVLMDGKFFVEFFINELDANLIKIECEMITNRQHEVKPCFLITDQNKVGINWYLDKKEAENELKRVNGEQASATNKS